MPVAPAWVHLMPDSFRRCPTTALHPAVEVMDATGRRLAKARLPESVAGMARLRGMVGGQLGESAEEDDAGQMVAGD